MRAAGGATTVEDMDITITGQASTTVAPGLAEVTLSVLGDGRDRAGVLADVERRAGSLLTALESLPADVLERVTTDGVTTWSSRRDRRTTHHASCVVTARFLDFSRMADLLSQWAAEGVEVGHIGWRLTRQQRDEAQAGLVAEALDAATAKAQRIAEHLGAGSLTVQRVSDSSQEGFAPATMRAMSFAGQAESAPVEARPEEIEINTELTVVFQAH